MQCFHNQEGRVEENPKILVVDDDPMTLELVEAYLSPKGYKVICASNGREGLEAFQREGTPVVVLDLVMPGIGGLECLREIKQINPETEVIIITGHSDEASAIKAVSLGAFDYIIKPLQIGRILTGVERALERYRLFEERKRFIERLEEEVAQRTRELEQSRQKLQAVFDGITDAIIIIDREYRIIAANFGAAALFNKGINDLPGRKCYTQIFQKDGPCDECPAKKTFITGRKESIITNLAREKGVQRVFEEFSFPIKYGMEDVDQAVLYIRDVTEQRRQQQYLLNSEKMAAVGKLAAGIAHELGNTLAIIGSSAQFLIKEVNENHPYRPYLEAIDRNVSSAVRIIQGLLSFAKPKELSLKPIDITQVLEKACFLLKGQFAKHNIRIFRQYNREVPEAWVDVEQMQQVFVNIFLNSINAMEGGGSVTLATSFNSEKGFVEVKLSDTGRGIPQDHLDKIFDPFFTTKEDGVGLGLSICHQLIQAHGGCILVESKEGQGTRFIISLPARPQDTTA